MSFIWCFQNSTVESATKMVCLTPNMELPNHPDVVKPTASGELNSDLLEFFIGFRSVLSIIFQCLALNHYKMTTIKNCKMTFNPMFWISIWNTIQWYIVWISNLHYYLIIRQLIIRKLILFKPLPVHRQTEIPKYFWFGEKPHGGVPNVERLLVERVE
jgi:hypothetical protein